MRTCRRTVRRRPSRLLLWAGALSVLMGGGEAAAAIPEFVELHAAVVSQDKESALVFIRAFPTSPLLDDLIAMLSPTVAQAVCADLPVGAEPAQAACRTAHLRVGTRGPWGQTVFIAEPQNAAGPRLAAAPGSNDPGKGDDAMSVASGAAPSVVARAPSTSTVRERWTVSVILAPPSEEDNPPAPDDDKPGPTAARKDAVAEAPKARRDPEPPAPSLGADPGSDPGASAGPTSHGADPGSDRGSDGGDSGGRDSHN